MRPIFTAAEMRALDARAIRELGIPGIRLMEAAGSGAAALIGQWFTPLRGRRVVVVCGKGNNGGDGFVVARRLRARGAAVRVFLAGSRGEVQGDAAEALAAWRGRVEVIDAGPDPGALVRALEPAELVVDALLGTGVTGPARGQVAAAIEAINEAGRRGVPVVSLDLPSGLDGDRGVASGPTVKATRTVTFAGLKRGLVLHPGAALAGRVDVVDIGIPAAEVTRGVTTWGLEEDDVRRYFPAREADAHKGRFGHLLIVAGSRGKTGAAALTGRAALRAGVGLCTIAAPASQQPIIAALAPEYMTEALPETAAGSLASAARDRVLELAHRMDAVALGPGLSLDGEAQALARALVAEVERPLIADADALSALAGQLELLRRALGPRALTPHPGEMARMLGVAIDAVQSDRLEVTRRFCREHRVALALKGAGTVVGGPDGRIAVNPTGNPGMAKGGSGDVLTGIVGALLARGLEPVAALEAGCYLHGLAGDLTAAARGEVAMVAGDIVEALPAALQRLAGPRP
ncbi:MAG TPA: NAD(P)H-hydrate dehydratase [Methylomirabilota bacterium]|nr:NAD(P)H-hydrate dehydratase [Methylomirabilota bacterium]